MKAMSLAQILFSPQTDRRSCQIRSTSHDCKTPVVRVPRGESFYSTGLPHVFLRENFLQCGKSDAEFLVFVLLQFGTDVLEGEDVSSVDPPVSETNDHGVNWCLLKEYRLCTWGL